MEDIIQEIINKASELKNNSKTNDYDIAEFLHIELGKVLYYDNNYTAKFINNKQETEISTARKNNMLKADAKGDGEFWHIICKKLKYSILYKF